MYKVYILKDHNNILGVYSSKEKAEKAKEKIIDIEIKYYNTCDTELYIQSYNVI